MTTLAPPLHVEAAAPPSPAYGLFSVAPPRSMSERIGATGVELEVQSCGSGAGTWTSVCPPAVPVSKTKFAVPAVHEFDPFVVYAMPDCKLLGTGTERMRARTEETLRRGEEFAVEKSLQALLAAATPTTVTAGAASIATAVSLLECWLAKNYQGGVGVIHAPRSVAPYASRDRLWVESTLPIATTPLGTPWDFAGGFCDSLAPGGAAAAAGTAWLYATGVTYVWRGEPQTVAGQGGLNTVTNDAVYLSERSYVVGYECSVAAAQVTLA